MSGLRDWLRRQVRAWQWGGDCPILLPHVKVTGERVETIDGEGESVSKEVSAALLACDGKRTAREIVREHRVRGTQLLEWHDRNWIVFWHSSLSDSPRRSDDDPLIVVSPHPDDAALSMGAYLKWFGGFGWPSVRIVLLDVFTRTAWWRLDQATGAERITEVRTAEERLVAKMLSAELRMLDLPEAMLRGYAGDELFTAPVGGFDDGVREAVRRAVVGLVEEYPESGWMLPLGVGNHVDHRLVRDVAFDALRERGVSLGEIFFYEDQPYAAERWAAGKREDYGDMVPGVRLEPEVSTVETMRWKLELNRVYWSQFTWPRLKGLEAYARRFGRRPGERWWFVPGQRKVERGR